MYPIWLMMWNDRMRRSSFCEAAPRTPVTMVRPATQSSSSCVYPTSVPEESA